MVSAYNILRNAAAEDRIAMWQPIENELGERGIRFLASMPLSGRQMHRLRFPKLPAEEQGTFRVRVMVANLLQMEQRAIAESKADGQ